MAEKKFFKRSIFGIIFVLILIAIGIIIVDPYFHYHKPFSFLSYRLVNQRYINDGVIKHFDYDAIITGTSMTENFKSSQFNELFMVNSIKVPFSGGSFKEINDNVETALKNNMNLKYVLRSLDYEYIDKEYFYMRYSSYPSYLYDDIIINDYKYWWNKHILKVAIRNLIHSLLKQPSTSFDQYCRWNEKVIFGKEEVLKNYKRTDKENVKKFLSQKDIERINKNINENIIRLPKKYPNVKFIYFITPYSIVYWDDLNQRNEVEKQIMIEKYIIEKILEIPNIELFSFSNNYELITNLNNYKDTIHYMGHINDQILIWIKNKKYKLIKENYMEYINKNLEFYKSYNYNQIFEK